ncbi:hypothetical protein KM176_04080 [Pseudooceanicola sp. CBS1P-1]|uniref:Uncharacterized protein n=1 Tax=Pseudooceanicola albus TaxID=2692189 RepID=A0A6L7G7D8_9RHOB|nr:MULTISPECIES: hypothetical protein [Pseudooceanicola]MBT9383032.1 hypothetical protein [Pseudooceanicola endophyticus]MXN19220.1 hypothetical protein [Pseudooceanicola albus]
MDFYARAFVATMHKAACARLSPGARQAVDDNPGMKGAVIAGQGVDDAGGKLARRKATSDVIKLAPDERAKWDAAGQTAPQACIAMLDGEGLPGSASSATVQGYVEDCKAMRNRARLRQVPPGLPGRPKDASARDVR